MQCFIKTKFSKILEKFTSVSIFRTMPQSSRFLPLVKNSFLYNVHVFLNQNIETETNYRGKRILDKYISYIWRLLYWTKSFALLSSTSDKCKTCIFTFEGFRALKYYAKCYCFTLHSCKQLINCLAYKLIFILWEILILT